MAKYRIILVIVFGSAVAWSTWNLNQEGSTGTAPASQGTNSQSKTVHSVRSQRDAAFLAQLDRTHPLKTVSSENDRAPALVAAYERMLAMGDYFNREKIQRDDMTSLLRHPENLSLAARSITDLAFAQATFHDKQALARVFAVKLLSEAARQGDTAPLFTAIHTLANHLDQTMSAGRPIEKSQDKDLADLVKGAMDTGIDERLESELSDVLQELGYRTGMHPELKKIFDDAVFFPLLTAVGREKAKVLVAEAFGES